MKRFVEGEDRNQVTLCLDDYVGVDNPVRVIDVFIDELDLTGLGFEGVAPADTGRPAYHPSVLLKIYVYGYLNRLQSSRRLIAIKKRGPRILTRRYREGARAQGESANRCRHIDFLDSGRLSEQL